jgi:hypothetical protein
MGLITTILNLLSEPELQDKVAPLLALLSVDGSPCSLSLSVSSSTHITSASVKPKISAQLPLVLQGLRSKSPVAQENFLLALLRISSDGTLPSLSYHLPCRPLQ